MMRAILVLQLATFCVLGMILYACAAVVVEHKVEEAKMRVSAEYLVMMPVQKLSEIHI